MNSCLYECTVMHARFSPKRHRFAYRIFLFALDLDELPDLHRRLRLFSLNRANLYSFREPDFLPTHEPLHPPARSSPSPSPAGDRHPGDDKAGSLKARVIAHLAEHDIDLAGGRVLLVTLPRVLGYLFNPVSFYFCYDRTGHPVATVAEVTNTFREVKPFVLGPDVRSGQPAAPVFAERRSKQFYVSPFSDVDVAFDFALRAPAENLALRIDDYTGAERTLTSTLTGLRRPLSDSRLAAYTLKYPLITLRIIALIHWHAFRLWLKRVPWFAKAARAADQRGLYRPHASLSSRSGPAHPPAAPRPSPALPPRPVATR